MRIEQPRSVYELPQYSAQPKAANDTRRVHFADEIVAADIRPTIHAARIEAMIKAQRPSSVQAQDTAPRPPVTPDPVSFRTRLGQILGKLSVGCGLILMPSFVAIWPLGAFGLVVPAGVLAAGLAAHFLANLFQS